MIFIFPLLILVLIGRYFYRLANRYDRNPFLYGFIGAGIGALSITLYFFSFILFWEFKANIGEAGSIVTSIAPILVCVGIIFGCYKLIERSFKKQSKQNSNPDILDL